MRFSVNGEKPLKKIEKVPRGDNPESLAYWRTSDCAIGVYIYIASYSLSSYVLSGIARYRAIPPYSGQNQSKREPYRAVKGVVAA